MKASVLKILNAPPKTKEDRLEEALSIFSNDLFAAAEIFRDRVQFALTGKESVRGNDGVALGSRQHRVYSRRKCS